MRAWEGRPGLGTEAPQDNVAAGGLSDTIIALRNARGLISAADAAWFADAVEALRDLVRGGDCFTIEAVRELVDAPAGHGAYGALMTAAQRSGWVLRVGSVSSAWPSRHGGEVTLWRGTRALGGDR